MSSNLKLVAEIIASGDTELLTLFISKSKVTLDMLQDFTYMLLFESYRANKSQFIKVIAESLCYNPYVEQGIDIILYLLNNKNMTYKVCRWVIKSDPNYTFFYLTYNMITFLYREDGLREFLIMLRKACKEKSYKVFEALIEECNSEIDVVYLEVLGQFKSKYSKGTYKPYVSNYGLTNKILSKYNNYELPTTISKEDVEKIYFKESHSEEEKAINDEKMKELMENKIIQERFGDGDVIENIVNAFNDTKVEGKEDLVRIMNESLLIDKMRNDEDFFRLLGPVNPGIGAEGTVCELFGGCRMFTCRCYVETDTADFPDDELDVDWFTGKCDYCDVKISRRCDALRMLVIDRGWSGCYCSIDHTINSMFYVNQKEQETEEELGEKLELTVQDKYMIYRMRMYYNSITTIGIQAHK